MRKKICLLSFVLTFILVAVCFLSCRKRQVIITQSFLRLMPADTFMYVGFKDWKILRDETGVFDFIKTARRLEMGTRLQKFFENNEKITPGMRENARRIQNLRDKVSLWDLFGGEVALAAFSLEEGEKPVLAFLCRLPENKTRLYQSYFEELILLFAGGERRKLTTESHLGETVSSIALPRVKIESCPAWSTVGDVFVLTSRPEGTRDIIGRLKGKKRRDLLFFNPDFKKIFADFNPAERGVLFIRTDDFIDWVRKIYRYQKLRLTRALEEGVPGSNRSSPPPRQLIYYLKSLVKIAGTVDIAAGNFGLSRLGYWDKIRFYLDEKDGSQSLLRVLKSPPRSWDVLDYIPAGAAGVEAGFLSLEKLYRPFLNYVSANPDHGEKLAEKWKKLQAESGFNPERDLFPWLGDEYAVCTVSLSRSMTDPGSFAFFWEVKSESEMEQSIDGLIALARKKLGASLNIIEEEYEGCKIRVAYLPLPLLSVTPTLGMVGEYLVLASRKDAFKNVVDTYRRRAESIRQNKDFIRMSRRLGQQGTAFSFSRLEERIEAAISVLRSVSSLFGMTVALGNPQTPEEAKERDAYLEKVNLLNDLARVLEDLKIFKFFGRVTSYRGGYIQLEEFIEIERR